MPLIPHNPRAQLGEIQTLVEGLSDAEMIGLPDLEADDLSLVGGLVACATCFDFHLRRLIRHMANHGIISGQQPKELRVKQLLLLGREIATRMVAPGDLRGALRRFDEIDMCFKARNTFSHLLLKRLNDTGAWLLLSADESDARYLPEPRSGDGLLYAIVMRSNVEQQLRDYRRLEEMFLAVVPGWMAEASR